METKNILEKLHETMTDSEIALECGVHTSTINRLRNGVSGYCKHSLAVDIEKLARRKGLFNRKGELK
jgi:DNA-binding MurR/RpiR family transcriptional regulator